MAEKPNLPIDFERAANLMDVVQKVASVAPTYTALSGVAMMELKEYNEAAQAYLDEIAKQRLEAEEAAAELEAKRIADEPKPKVYVPLTDVPEEPVARRV